MSDSVNFFLFMPLIPTSYPISFLTYLNLLLFCLSLFSIPCIIFTGEILTFVPLLYTAPEPFPTAYVLLEPAPNNTT